MSAKTVISVRLPSALANRLEVDAKENGMSLSGFVRLCLVDRLRERDQLAALQTMVTSAIKAHEAALPALLATVLDRYIAKETHQTW